MITKLTVESFKSLESVEIELGAVNVFVGANGSGKSNLLEAIGVLSAAAAGRVDDESLMRRGVRPGVPQLYKSAFPAKRQPPHIFFGAANARTNYEVSLLNPLRGPQAPWRYKTELWEFKGRKLVSRSPKTKPQPNPEKGLAALKAVQRRPDDPALEFLDVLGKFAIFSPATRVLRGIAPEPQPREPVGLSGGGLPAAVNKLISVRKKGDKSLATFYKLYFLLDWAKGFRPVPATSVPLSPSATVSPEVVEFTDRFMKEGSNVLTGFDASEGALHVLFAAALALCPQAPRFFAIDNVDQTLNPRLARRLAEAMCSWIIEGEIQKQVLLTAHNPAVLDGLPLGDERVRLFTVGRSNTGRTVVRRVEVTPDILDQVKEGWSLSRLWVQGHLGGVPSV